MSSRKVLRVASQVKYILSQLLLREMRDPRLGFVTILEVEVRDDLTAAHVHFSVLGPQGERSKTLHALEAASGFLQRQVGRRLRTRNTPALHFVLDESAGRLERIDQLLEEARRKDEGGPDRPPPPPPADVDADAGTDAEPRPETDPTP